MKKVTILMIVLVTFYVFAAVLEAGSSGPDDLVLEQTFNLAGEKTVETQYFLMESFLLNYALDGTRVSTDVFRVKIICVPAELAGTERDEYTCVKFTVQIGDTPETEIPALKNWKHYYTFGTDEKGQVFGIDHSKFENIVDVNGNPLPPGKPYHVYNAFIDFHGFINVIAESIPGGNSIQDLEKIGQKIVHAAAFTEPPVNLGSSIAEGSHFKNGEVTLEFKGLSLVNERQCSLLGYDSGESSYLMIMNPMPNFEVRTVGSSHYKGDIYKDLKTNWVQKVTLDEVVISETTLPVEPNKINSVAEREIMIRNVSEEEFLSE